MRTDTGYTRGPIPIPRSRKLSNEIHTFLSIKAGMRMVTCESPLEADAVYAAEGDPKIVWLCPQGLRLDRAIGMRPWYTFDLSTRTNLGLETHWEIKPDSELVSGIHGKREPKYWNEIVSACAELGFNCGFKTSRDLETQEQLIRNWQTLLPLAFAAYESPNAELLALLAHWCREEGITLRHLIRLEPRHHPEVVTAHVARLLHEGQIKASLDGEEFTNNSVLSIP
jgi:hypothetical protein